MQRKKVLIVEDEPLLSKMLEEGLVSSGFDVLTAENGEEGFEVAKEKQPDIVLLDIVMPKMDGLTVMKKLKREASTHTMPVIILTNLEPNDEAIDRIAKDNPAYYLTKSNTEVSEIVEKVKEVLEV
ncbi:response regulator [Candidatus Dojkabacteria bacterium]|uniref:Response regulator n=1 Tax=Candidatus Dojkabacteria bacterium TaxID=2099670 RepID=A0A955L6Y1_9BACT|nr:response regulator [Candidatus Dojkabacteria bacterium]